VCVYIYIYIYIKRLSVAVKIIYSLQVVELHNMMACSEATLGPDGQIAVVNGEGTTLLAGVNTDENGVVPVRKQGSCQNNKADCSKENHVCSICKSAQFSTSYSLASWIRQLNALVLLILIFS
jgi:hypothetical protein